MRVHPPEGTLPPAIRFTHIAGVTSGMDVEWTFQTAGDGTHVRIVHVWDGPPVPVFGTVAATMVIGPVFVHGIASRTLAGLAALAALTLVGAVVYSPWLWAAQGLLDLAVVGYLLVLRKVARRERLAARRAARAVMREALRTPVAIPVQQDVVHATVAQEALPGLPHPSVPLAPVHDFPMGRRVVARAPAPVGWQQSAVVGLDDDDIGFADIDEYQPRRVANG